jgi:hypothetical protein
MNLQKYFHENAQSSDSGRSQELRTHQRSNLLESVVAPISFMRNPGKRMDMH